MENFNYNQILSVTMILFAIIDILGSIPVVISLRNKVGHIQSEKASIVALLLMIFFLFIGEEMLKIIGLDISSFAIAGSVVIFIIAMEMILGINLFKVKDPIFTTVSLFFEFACFASSETIILNSCLIT